MLGRRNCLREMEIVGGSHGRNTSKGSLGEQWIHQIKQHNPDFHPTKYSVICSKHFIESAYYIGGIHGNPILKKTEMLIKICFLLKMWILLKYLMIIVLKKLVHYLPMI